MKNPLYKRIPRELKRNLGKHLAMFLFLTLTIGFCSGYFIATSSLSARLSENYDTYVTEDGHFILNKEIDNAMTQTIKDNDADVHELFYKDKSIKNNKLIRIYKIRDTVNLLTMYSGEMPKKDNEISIDRLYARNNDIQIGDIIKIDGKSFRVTGFSVVPDYTSLYKNNTDFMFNALDFCVAFVTENAFDQLDESGLFYNYVWTYHDRTLNEQEKHDKTQKLMNDLADCAKKEYEDIKAEMLQKVMSGGISFTDTEALEEMFPPVLSDFVPDEANSAINMATEDVGGDKIIVITLLYITIAVIALAAAITTKSTVEQEASVIGTLRASGFRRGEIIGHYMILSVISTLAAALIGNVIGYTFMNSVCASMYYGSYSFPVYTPCINAEAFIMTTAVPVGIVLAVNFVMLTHLLSLPPLQFLRHELKKKKKSRNIRLRFGSFTSRFRTRVILRNYQAYLVLFVGILFANLLLMFSFIWTPLLDSFRSTVLDNVIADYQYILKAPVDTSEPDAEKFAVYTLKNDNGEDITIYGISEESKYVKGLELSGDKFYISSAYADKYGVKDAEVIHFSEKFSSREYNFTNTGAYDYPASLCVFTGLDNFRKLFDMDDDYYTGYFSNKKIKDIDELYISSVIGKNDLTMTADQLENSVGFVKLFAFFAIAVYILMIYILSKMITERNARSVSVLKILGYKVSEISGLYNFATGIVVLISMLLSLPLNYLLIRIVYYAMMQRYNGWLSFTVPYEIYPQMIAIGCLCFLAAYLLEMRRVRHIAMNEAIKDMD